MEKKGFLLMVGLVVLLAASCATTGSNPRSTAPSSPSDISSVSTPATGTPGDVYQSLIGEWRGDFTNGFRGTLIIREIDIAKKKARGIYTVKGTDLAVTVIDGPQVMDFTPGPNPMLLVHSDIPGGT